MKNLGFLIYQKRTGGARRSSEVLTIREAAEQIGISPSTLCRLEAGKSPDLVTLPKICRWLGITTDELLEVGKKA